MFFFKINRKTSGKDPDPCFYLESGISKISRIRTNPDPQHCIFLHYEQHYLSGYYLILCWRILCDSSPMMLKSMVCRSCAGVALDQYFWVLTMYICLTLLFLSRSAGGASAVALEAMFSLNQVSNLYIE